MTRLERLAAISAVLSLALVVGCAGEAGKDGAPGPEGPAGQDGADGLPGQDGAVGLPGRDGVDGLPGRDGVDGQPGRDGVDGRDGLGEGTLAGLITDAAGGGGLATAVVTLDPDVGPVAVAADGSFSVVVPIGAYLATIEAPGYVPLTTWAGVAAGVTTSLAVALDAEGTAPGESPVITVTGQLNVGFGAPVTIQASISDADSPDPTIEWTQTAGPAVTIAGGTTGTITFTTAAVDEAIPTDHRFGVLPFEPDHTGNYTFRVTATDESGHATSANVSVKSVNGTQTGLRNVAVDSQVYLKGDAGAQTTWSWSVAAQPAGSAAALADATSRFPHFVPDVAGTYSLTESVSGRAIDIIAGTWVGAVGDTTCAFCHNGTIAPDQFTPWEQTGHATAMARKIADVEGHFGANCVSCHTVGYDVTASNGGFDDVAAAAGWTFPATIEEDNWDEMVANYPQVAKLANIQCENCHGPNNGEAHTTGGARISLASEICATCHASGAHHDRVALWRQGAHHDLDRALETASADARGAGAASCARCHSAQGFVAFAEQIKARDDAGTLKKPDGSAVDLAYLTGLGLTDDEVLPVTCAACHDPHDATNPGQLRIYGDTPELPNGMAVSGAGTGAICMVCHNTRNGRRGDEFTGATQDARDPHTPGQTDVLYGVNAYFVDLPMPSRHLAIEDTCATCHVKLVPESVNAGGTNHTFMPDESICANCHSEFVTGTALAAEVVNGLARIEIALVDRLNTDLAAALAADGDFWADEAIDEVSGVSGTASFAAMPIAYHLVTSHGQMAFELEFASAVTVTRTDGTTFTQTHLAVKTNKLRDTAGGAVLYPNGHTVNKAFWNYLLIEDDGSEGIHNPTFAINVISATTAAIAALP